MIHLPELTVVCIDCYNYGKAAVAINKTLELIKPSETIFFTDSDVQIDGVITKKIKPIRSKEEYSVFCIKELGKHIDTSHCLLIQWDGYVINENAWREEFLHYDYIGAPWNYIDGRNVGNGGFSLRSKKLLDILVSDKNIAPLHPEDDAICRTYRPYLEEKYKIRFAPEDLADCFSYELKEPNQPTFGFHGFFHFNYQPYVLITRSGAMGDVILVEPVMRYFAQKGYNIILDTAKEFWELFSNHPYPVRHSSMVDLKRIVPERYINLDMAYESKPRQNRLKSYFQMSGITDYVLSKPILYPLVNEKTKLFKKYAVLHIDQKSMPHRNIYGVNWKTIKKHLEAHGYLVLQIGQEQHESVGHEINTSSLSFLKFLIAGCDLFIGIDSGPLNIAMAYDKKCIGFFGSVNPEYVFPDLTNLEVIQQPCIYQHCYHTKTTTVGVECVFDKNKPPCCVAETEQVIDAINKTQNV
jgi:ADP-heptose:LPS heptosyltransferase